MNQIIGKRFFSSSSSSLPEYLFPSVRRLLSDYNIVNVSEIKPTGPQSRLLKGDILSYIQSKNLKPIDSRTLQSSTTASSTTTATATTSKVFQVDKENEKRAGSTVKFEDIPHNNIRKVIATKLTQSKHIIPHLYMTVECDISKVLSLRQKLLPLKVSVNDFVLRAVALALKDCPEANAKWNETTQEIQLNPTVDVSFAVSTDRGLITPIIKNTNTKQLGDISKESKELAIAARDSKLKPEQFIGGTFSVSNLGMFGITHFNAIINYPQAGILAIGTGRRVIKNQQFTTADLDKLDSLLATSEAAKPQIIDIMDVTLSGDNRVFTDEIAAKFLDTFKKYISNPESMLL
ncbi:pyruvate dehydrogenase complex [Tieghemostelium lacteum]|uniref:Pyruvate dehydrogenase complex n=1 Tax=Tieghemostelium lacteum TaxID=361077 RepID=A0A151ZGD5_TIELA|nr:pyruvate dehydrogenase complex [Tieghemostelium lacteum]|eukprot:KYQ92987.1 pyruvate dehydrogenase complex [Tieghemostelium lacteum]